jgi:hypothetical protein
MEASVALLSYGDFHYQFFLRKLVPTLYRNGDLTEMPPDNVTRSGVRRFFQQQQVVVFAAVAVFALLSILKVPTHLWAC